MRYKLKKWYPSLPKSFRDKKIILEPSTSKGWYTRENETVSEAFKASEIEDNPEYWEEIGERDYEILSLIHGENIFNDIRSNSSTERAYYNKERDTWLAEEGIGRTYRGHTVKIHSVKRLSDGQVFTLGDKIKCTYFWTSPRYIKEFRYGEERLIKQEDGEGMGGTSLLKDIEPYVGKEFLFTTEDGVNIYEGDTYFFVRNNSFKGIVRRMDNAESIKLSKTPSEITRFSTEEAAEEYLRLNEKKFSIVDIEKIIGEATICQFTPVDRILISMEKLRDSLNG